MKITYKNNIRVEVTPTGYYYPDIKRKPIWEVEVIKLADCKQMADEIKRRINHVEGVSVKWDEEEICSHCSMPWSVDEYGRPVCCEEAIKEHNQKR